MLWVYDPLKLTGDLGKLERSAEQVNVNRLSLKGLGLFGQSSHCIRAEWLLLSARLSLRVSSSTAR
jgi:hypothetical protein